MITTNPRMYEAAKEQGFLAALGPALSSVATTAAPAAAGAAVGTAAAAPAAIGAVGTAAAAPAAAAAAPAIGSAMGGVTNAGITGVTGGGAGGSGGLFGGASKLASASSGGGSGDRGANFGNEMMDAGKKRLLDAVSGNEEDPRQSFQMQYPQQRNQGLSSMLGQPTTNGMDQLSTTNQDLLTLLNYYS